MGGSSEATTRARRDRVAVWALATAIAAGCAKFSGSESLPDGGSVDDASATDAPAAADAGANDAADASTPPNLCPGGGHTFCDDFNTGDLLDGKWSTITNGESFSASTTDVVSQPRALRLFGKRTTSSALARAEVRLPTPAKLVRCEMQLRLRATTALGSLPVTVRLAGPNGYLIAILFLYPDAFELGAERALGSAAATYGHSYNTYAIPHLNDFVKTTLELSLTDKRLRLRFGSTEVAALEIDVPAGTTTTTFSIGELRVNDPSGTMVDTVFDDVACDVDPP